MYELATIVTDLQSSCFLFVVKINCSNDLSQLSCKIGKIVFISRIEAFMSRLAAIRLTLFTEQNYGSMALDPREGK